MLLQKNTLLSPTYPESPRSHFRILETLGSAWLLTLHRTSEWFSDALENHFAAVSTTPGHAQGEMVVGRKGTERGERKSFGRPKKSVPASPNKGLLLFSLLPLRSWDRWYREGLRVFQLAL